jgi:hypothetical protein
LKEAIQENFGGKCTDEGYPAEKFSAYMLVYIRKSKLDYVLVDITEKDLTKQIGTSPLIFEQ